jgi:hypothetical protein
VAALPRIPQQGCKKDYMIGRAIYEDDLGIHCPSTKKVLGRPSMTGAEGLILGWKLPPNQEI